MKTISNLPSLAALQSGDSIALVQGSNTYKATLRQVKELFSNDPGLNRTFNYSGDVLISGRVLVTGDILGSGNAKFGKSSSNSVTIIGNLNQSGNLNISGNIQVTGGLGVSGNVNLGKDINSITQVSGNLKIVGNTYNYGDLGNVGNVKVTGNIDITGSGKFGTAGRPNTFYFNGLTTVDHTGIFNSGIKSLGLITGNDNLYIAGNIASQKILGASGDTVLGQSSTNTLTVNAASTFSAPALFQSTVNVGSNLGVVGDLRVSGDTYLGNSQNDNITLVGKTVFNRKIEVSGGIDVTGNVVISGHLLANQSGFIRSGLNVGDQLFVSGKTFLGYGINNATHIQGSGFVSGHLVVHGNLNVSGTALFPNGIQDDTQKKCMFDPQVKVGVTDGIYMDSGVGVNKIVFILKDPIDSRSVKWDTSVFEAGDIVYVSGILDSAAATNTQQNRLDKSYNGFFTVNSINDNLSNRKLLYLNPTGLPMPRPSVAGTSSGWVPYILVHYKSGWLNNISGIVPVRGKKHSNTASLNELEINSFHHQIIFNRPFSSSNYISILSCNQGTGYDPSVQGDKGNIAGRLPVSSIKTCSVSYMDTGSISSKTVFANTDHYDTNDTIISDGSTYGIWNLFDADNMFEGNYFPTMPTRVYAKFEPI